LTKRPFSGRTFLVATTEDRASRLAATLRAQGALAVPFPTVRLISPKDLAPLDRALRCWPSFDWVVFTSAHAVEAVVSRAKELGVDLSAFRPKVAAVGPATKAAAESAGLAVHAMPSEYLTDDLAVVLGDVRGKRVLLPRSRIARKSLAEDLVRLGAEVVEVDAYDAVPASPDLSMLQAAGPIDVVLFTSASAARYLASLLPADTLEDLKATARAACIGPVTAEAVRSLGFRVAWVAEDHTIPGLVKTLTEAPIHG